MTMPSKTDKVLALANEVMVCHVATVEQEQPRVRSLLMWYADTTGFYFHTSSSKKIASQLLNNSKVELAFLKQTANQAETQELRIAGTVEVINDKNIENRLLQERPWLNQIAGDVSDVKLVLFRVIDTEARIWNMAMNMRESEIEKVYI